MAVSDVADEQPAGALRKAAAVRRARAGLKDRLRRGALTVAEALEEAGIDDGLGKMRVSELLEPLLEASKVTVGQVMTELQIAPTRRLRGLSPRQRFALLEKFSSH